MQQNEKWEKFSRVGSWVFRFVGFGVTSATTDSALTEALMGKMSSVGGKWFKQVDTIVFC